MTFRLRVPRPSHTESSQSEQEAWKKKLAKQVAELKSCYPEAEIELWCEDEHRLGLKPILRRVYVPEGEAPIANVNWRISVVMVVCLCTSSNWRSLLVDSPLCKYPAL